MPSKDEEVQECEKERKLEVNGNRSSHSMRCDASGAEDRKANDPRENADESYLGTKIDVGGDVRGQDIAKRCRRHTGGE